MIGAGLEWVRAQPTSASWGWQSDSVALLLAAWLAVALLAWWPNTGARQVPPRAGLLLGALFLGMLVMHELIRR